MRKAALAALGALMALFGALFTLQGLGYVSGSSMSGSTTWAVIGPIVAGLGVALLFVALHRPAGKKRADE